MATNKKQKTNESESVTTEIQNIGPTDGGSSEEVLPELATQMSSEPTVESRPQKRAVGGIVDVESECLEPLDCIRVRIDKAR